MNIICFKLHCSPADIPQSSLRTMSKDVRCAIMMLPNNDEVLKKSFAERIEISPFLVEDHNMISHHVLCRYGRKSNS